MMPYDQQTERPVSSTPAVFFQQGLNKLLAQALAEKSLIWFSSAGSLGLWTYAAIYPEPLRLGCAAGFTLLSYIPMIWKRS